MTSQPSKWTRGRKLALAFVVLTLLLLGCAIVLFVAGAIFKGYQNPLLTDHILTALSLTDLDFNAGLALGVMIVITGLLGMYGFLSGMGIGNTYKTMGLLVFNWSMVATMSATVIIGCIIWFDTLTTQKDFMDVWNNANGVTQGFIQDSFSCCGYWNATTSGLLTNTTGFCSSITNVSAIQGCVTPMATKGEFCLNNVFSTIFGFGAVEISLLLTSLCLMANRKEEERFRRIDEKSGRRGGFV